MLVKKIWNYFDKLEDKVRARLSHAPIIYAIVGAIGITLVWKGIWEMAEFFPWLFGFPSFILGLIILLLTGLLVSFFVGDSIIISGFRGEKKLVEKVEHEVRDEHSMLQEITYTLEHMENQIDELEHEKK